MVREPKKPIKRPYRAADRRRPSHRPPHRGSCPRGRLRRRAPDLRAGWTAPSGSYAPRMAWHPGQLGGETGRTFVVTGANTASASKPPETSSDAAPTSCWRCAPGPRARRSRRASRGPARRACVELDLSALDHGQRRRHGRAAPVDPAGLRGADGNHPPASRRASRGTVAAAARERLARHPPSGAFVGPARFGALRARRSRLMSTPPPRTPRRRRGCVSSPSRRSAGRCRSDRSRHRARGCR
jgi:hypothetical protein